MEYRRGARLGVGGTAEVFAGELVGTQGFARPVAIKRILPGYAEDPRFAAQLAAEAQLTARLRHPNIVETLDFSRDADGALVLVMELVQGVTLAALMTAGPVPPAAAGFLVAEILRGLGHAHAAGLVHRDVSPHNVLLSWDGAVKVSDFGIAKARDASEASTVLKGKPAYMSPEQASAQPLDPRSDLFAVGVILWELLTGRALFKADDTRATLAAVLFGTVPHPRSVAKRAPKDLSAIAMRLLAKDREHRYASAEAVLAALSAASPQGEQGRQALVAHLATAFTRELGNETSPPFRVRWLVLALACVVVAAGVTFAIARMRSDEAQSVDHMAVQRTPPPTPRDVSFLLYRDPKLIPYENAMSRSLPEVRWPSDSPPECIDEVEVMKRFVRCGRMSTADRNLFEGAAKHFVEYFLTHWPTMTKSNQNALARTCRNDVNVLQGLGVQLFQDCRLSAGWLGNQ